MLKTIIFDQESSGTISLIQMITIAYIHSQGQLGEVPGAVYLGGSAGKTSWMSPYIIPC